MKKATLALLAVLALGACANGGTWTPQAAGRTAGQGQIEHVQSHSADTAVSGGLRK